MKLPRIEDDLVEHQLKTEDPILDQIVEQLIRTYSPLRIYLFGSRAAGTYGSDSDYDILLVVSNDAPNELKTATPAYRSLWGIRAAIDVVVWTEREFDIRLPVENSLPASVVREGLLLHVA